MEKEKLTAFERKRRLIVAIREKGSIDWAKLVMVIAPLLHLILTPIHVAALLKLEDQICGFIMFLSVLVGLVVLFEATRVKNDETTSKVLFLLFMLADCLLLFWLLGIYRYALGYQQTLREPEVVIRAVTLTVSMLACYGVSFALTILSFFSNGKETA